MDQNPPMASDFGPPRRRRARTRGAALLVLASIVSVQCGAALATTLFDEIGTSGAVFLRAAFGALVLVAVTRAASLRVREWPHRDVLLLGAAVAAVNLFFYAALDRLPLGITVTLEFVGPLGVAIVASHRRRDLVWALLAAIGIVLLSDGTGGESVDVLGVALALTAGAFWGAYIVLSDRVGDLAPGAERGDDGGGDLGRDRGAVRARPGRRRDLRPLPPGDRRRGRHPQHRRPLRLRDRGAAAAAAGGLRGADEPRAGGRGGDRLHRALAGPGAARDRRDRLRRHRLGGRAAERRDAPARTSRARRAGARARRRSARRPRRRGRPGPGRRRGGGCSRRRRS